MINRRLILVSNRLPFRITEKKGEIEFSPSSGGLVSSIKSYIQKTNSSPGSNKDNCPVWIGTSDIAEKKFKDRLQSGSIFYDDFELAPVFIPPSTKDKFYNGFCNNTIWPLFHYFPSYAKFSDNYYEQYVKANTIFCEKVLEMYKPNDIIWIHDYHLMLLPELLREHLPNATIGFFLHIPFPSFELFRLLPSKWRKEILNGLLGADLLGFHTNDYVQHFLKSIRQILGFENTLRIITTPDRSVTVDTFPISIDYYKFSKASTDSDTFNERNKIKKRLYDTKLIISVDRLDYAKGLINRLESFEFFLEKYSEHKRKVVYILLVVPSRDIITKYKETKREIEGLVSRINGKYGSIDWTPIVYQYKTLEFKKLLALYLAADVALITPMRDGMNLVAKEFVASRTDKRGVLILSETAGASSELGEAILVNPTDRGEIAGAIQQALSMPVEEQTTRNETMQKRLQEYDVMKWAEDFISQLLIRKEKQEKLKVKEVTTQIENQIIEHYSHSESRLIFLDYDGTLAPLARLPHLASPGGELISLLKTVGGDSKNEIVLISGRPMEVLKGWFEHLPVSLVAEHGAFYKQRGVDWRQTVPVNASWKPSIIPVLNLFTERCAGTFVEEKTLSLAWHYRNAEKELGFLRSRELINALVELSSHLDFQIIEGNKVIETRARGIDKGIAASLWLKKKQHDFVLAIGDDKTDEDLFKVIPTTQYSIRVGLTQSVAKYNFKQQKDVLSFLKKLQTRKQVTIENHITNNEVG
ncbi:MAG: bifunctional alpha,alpha-trehalose-phosphate synthase (UDP-forming)/trehalose-phosphatase [Bacteroidia bacterium]|nr:bifunctional alpha,alpha-trehalose-phosphate synthase (UDP-forming)/trehalose-phosphatase [Bacteroidia bacterium]